ncbi:MAG: hypothetical protein WDN46_22930 [Methylocella sp.]
MTDREDADRHLYEGEIKGTLAAVVTNQKNLKESFIEFKSEVREDIKDLPSAIAKILGLEIAVLQADMKRIEAKGDTTAAKSDDHSKRLKVLEKAAAEREGAAKHVATIITTSGVVGGLFTAIATYLYMIWHGSPPPSTP